MTICLVVINCSLHDMAYLDILFAITRFGCCVGLWPSLIILLYFAPHF